MFISPDYDIKGQSPTIDFFLSSAKGSIKWAIKYPAIATSDPKKRHSNPQYIQFYFVNVDLKIPRINRVNPVKTVDAIK